MLRLKGKTTVVTGAGSGIGRSTAILFAEEGARVAAIDIDGASGEATAREIRRRGGSCLHIRTDVRRAAEVDSAMAAVEEEWGAPAAVVNVVGGSGRKWGDGPVAECTEDGWDRLMELNLKSVFLCCRAGIRAMLRAGNGGAVVNVSSVLGLVGGDEDFGTHAYAATKGGIISLTRGIASYYATHRIRANVVCPGLIATSMSRRAQDSEAIRSRLPNLQPLTGDFGRPEDVARATLYLASDESSFVTGAVLTVDGGWTAR